MKKAPKKEPESHQKAFKREPGASRKSSKKSLKKKSEKGGQEQANNEKVELQKGGSKIKNIELFCFGQKLDSRTATLGRSAVGVGRRGENKRGGS